MKHFARSCLLGLEACLPAAFDDGPISLVAVHRRDHAAAARGDAKIDARVLIYDSEVLLDLSDIPLGSEIGYVSPVGKTVQPQAPDPFGVGAVDQRKQVVHVRVDISIGQ